MGHFDVIQTKRKRTGNPSNCHGAQNHKKEKSSETNIFDKKEQKRRLAEAERFDKIDEKVEYFRQGGTNDCWLLADLRAFAEKERGARILRESVQKNCDGSYTVTFQGLDGDIPNNKFRVTKEDFISEKNKKLSTGDPDAKLWEIATRKLLDSLPAELAEELGLDKKNDKLNTGISSFFIRALVKENVCRVYSQGTILYPKDERYPHHILLNNGMFDKNSEKILDDFSGHLDTVVITAGSPKKDKLNLKGEKYTKPDTKAPVTNHSYIVTDIDADKDLIYLEEPRKNSSKSELVLTYDEFSERFGRIDYVFLPKERKIRRGRPSD